MLLADRIKAAFAAIFKYRCKRPMIVGTRKTPFGKYDSFAFRKASKSPFVLLLKECHIIEEAQAVEILVKQGADQHIDDTDLESVLIGIREVPDTLFILAYQGEVPKDDYERLFKFFTRHLIIVLPLGEKELAKLEKWVAKGNFNACLVHLALLADRVTSEGEMPLRGKYAYRAKWQEEANKVRLERMAKLKGPQLRTLIKKLSFLLSFEKAGMEVSEACELAHISRKTFYLWCEKDPVFKRLLHTSK